MTPRQRVLAAIEHGEPDRVPVDFWALDDVYERLGRAWKLADRQSILDRIGADLRYCDGPAMLGERRGADAGTDAQADGIVTDHWGVKRRFNTVTGVRRDGTEYTWTYKHLHESPLAGMTSVAQIENYRWPSADVWDYSNVRAACLAIRDAGYAVVAGADRLDRTAQLKPAMYLRGAEQFMTDLALDPAMAECILERIGDYYLDYNRRFFEAAGGAIDVFFMGDDMGTQASTWVSPDMYRKFFKRRLAAYCELAHSCGMKVMYHTCGKVTSLIGDFLDAGLDILQSLQPGALGEDLAAIKRRFGKDLCFQGGIDIQDVLPNGTPAEVARHVKSRVDILAAGGGYIFGTAHNILPDTPTENVLALIEAYREYGEY